MNFIKELDAEFESKLKITPDKKTIESIPFAQLTSAEEIKEFVSMHSRSLGASWFAPQLLAYIASNYEFTPDATAYVNRNIKTDFDKGIWRLLNRIDRSAFVKKQLLCPELSSITPVYMAAHKIHDNIPYSSWNLTTGYKYILTPVLQEVYEYAQTVTREQAFTGMTQASRVSDELGSLRLKCLIYGGKQQDPSTFYGVYKVKGTILESMPRLARNMLLQTWCCHPSNRKPYQILDPWDWDALPEPLIDVEPWQPYTHQN